VDLCTLEWPLVPRNVPSPVMQVENKGRPLHSMAQLLIGCMEILFLKLAATIFGLD
jgi:hypothetical protein